MSYAANSVADASSAGDGTMWLMVVLVVVLLVGVDSVGDVVDAVVEWVLE